MAVANQSYSRIFLLISILLFTGASCNRSKVDKGFSSSIVINNQFSQKIKVSIYRFGQLRLNFQVPSNGFFVFKQSIADGPVPPDFNSSDSAVFVFADGKRKKDLNCRNSYIAATVVNCQSDKVNVFNENRYAKVFDQGEDVTFIYKVTQADYDEAK